MTTKRTSKPALHAVPANPTQPATQANALNQRALHDARALSFVDIAKRTATSDGDPTPTTALSEEPLTALAERGKVIEAPFDMLALAMLPEYSSELGQCIEAMQVNIESFGHRQVPRVNVKDPNAPDQLKKDVLSEAVRLANFFEYCTEDAFVEFRKKLRGDYESTGNAWFEVVRDSRGQIQSFHHIPAYQMRLCRTDDKPTKVKRKILKLQEDGSVAVETVDEIRYFRLHVQCRSVQRRNLSIVNGAKMRWFKTFGDPRVFNNETGDLADETLSASKRANEVIHLKHYSPRTPYGLPRFIGNLLSIYGDRASEEINYTTFRNNNIPSMAVLVSGGQLTEGSLDRIEKFVEASIQGSDNYSKFLIIEGETLAEDGEDGGQVKIEIKPLTSEQIHDAMFQKYSANNQDKIRRAFRLPPILVGKAEDYNRATAEASIKLADEQVFAPERDSFDAIMNRLVYPDMGIRYHKFKSNSPNTTDNETLVGIIAGAEKTGGMTPRIARVVMSQVLGQDLNDDFPEGFDPDVPFSLTMAEAVKNKADPAEPGQQVTALKALMGEVDVNATDPLTTFLVELNVLMEKSWRRSVSTLSLADYDKPDAKPAKSKAKKQLA